MVRRFGVWFLNSFGSFDFSIVAACVNGAWGFEETRCQSPARMVSQPWTANMSATHLSRLKPLRGYIMSAPNPVQCVVSSWFVNALFYPILSRSKSRFGFKIEGKDQRWIFYLIFLVSDCLYFYSSDFMQRLDFYLFIPVASSNFQASYAFVVNFIARSVSQTSFSLKLSFWFCYFICIFLKILMDFIFSWNLAVCYLDPILSIAQPLPPLRLF